MPIICGHIRVIPDLELTSKDDIPIDYNLLFPLEFQLDFGIALVHLIDVLSIYLTNARPEIGIVVKKIRIFAQI